MSSEWEAATHEGLAALRRREHALTSVEQRLAWLDDALEIALLSGAIERSRTAKQREIDRRWHQQE